ncbi:MAG: ester cyclase [Nocardioidaceae bacterium]
MSREDLENIDDRGMEAWNAHDAAAFLDLFADDFVWRDLTVTEPMRSRDEARSYIQGWFTAFPDMNVRTVNRLIEGDSLAVELEFTGTNTGPLRMGGMEMPATGKSVTGKGAYFGRVSEGKIVEFSSHPDAAGMMAQLGLMQSPV